MKIKIGDILKVNPSKALVKVINIQMLEATAVYLKDYWKRKYNIILPKSFVIIKVNFVNGSKEYAYPKYRKCIKKPLRQKKAKKLFKEETIRKNQTKSNAFLSKFRELRSQYLQDINDERGSDHQSIADMMIDDGFERGGR